MNCPYCNRAVTFIASSAHIYNGRDFGPVWECAPCKAWVGCHKGTRLALGTPANAELRTARSAVHSAFDPIWKEGDMSRSRAYAWLANRLEIPVEDCHIGQFDLDMCQRAIAVASR